MKGVTDRVDFGSELEVQQVLRRGRLLLTKLI